MYKLLIVEDEKIERESLKAMVQEFNLPITSVLSADNGEDGLQKYYEEQPDIIMTDIDMPLLGGLDMIEKIRKKDSRVTCLVLTSYDYFSYAQKAIQLDVEDFIVKPADKEAVRKSLTQALETLIRNKNTYTQTSSLVHKMKEMKNLLESECFYTILTRHDECRLIEAFQLAGISPSSCICAVFKEGDHTSEHLLMMRKDLEDPGYVCIQGKIHQLHILFIMANHCMEDEDCTLILNVIEQNAVNEWSIGSLQHEAASFYRSYEDAQYNLNNHERCDIIPVKKDSKKDTAVSYATLFLEHLDRDQQEDIHALCQELLQYDFKEINQILCQIMDQLIQDSNRRFSLGINRDDIEVKKLDYENYQNMEIIVTQTLNLVLKPLKTMKYQNSSSLIKKSMTYIEKNYAKPISLNRLAEELQVSPFYLSKLFGRELGHNFTEIVNDIRIRQAKKLIRENTSFKKVAYDVGFGSQSYFTKMFRKVVGMSPTDYRKLFL